MITRRLIGVVAVALSTGALAVPGAIAANPATVARAARAVVVVETATAEGSAFAFGRRGEYLTNAHVVRGSRTVTIVDSRGRRAKANVVARDDRMDVALLRSGLVEPRLTRAIKLPRPGETVLTIGAAAGLPGTVTEGIVSAVGRLINGVRMIQTDAALNPGNSGGALIDAAGHVVGVTSSRVSDAEGIAFAIPIATAQRAVRAAAAVAAARSPEGSSGRLLGLPTMIAIALLVLAAAIAGAVAAWIFLRRKMRRPPTPPAAGRVTAPDPVVVIRQRRSQTTNETDEPSSRSTEETWT